MLPQAISYKISPKTSIEKFQKQNNSVGVLTSSPEVLEKPEDIEEENHEH
jgi:hypothetical protein